ncbi:P-loop containing nucleoside triphosphate hydrolase protein [Laetiporus sulphureus 93-53]|uniref:Guanine nucleotide-binding protein-like 1 n=1 Tax=Laetiporus sulphureus 93-53 TaxID=1314785 RepID=A0A165C929_9APHY|nr:P-loop containing nucleoside triphosphate hydrolase protein [Laetiporus sulphureus 93-53]KZT02411.1 P-loop containing nucleoside triphosphate hydrolase protein [Laetiporus sulphureus 93-53]
MHRKKPFSSKQKKEQIQLKRAVKRGDVSPPPKLDRHGRKSKKASLGPGTSSAEPSSTVAPARLQSSFIKLPAKFLEETRVLAAKLPLIRPISPEAAILSDAGEHAAPRSRLAPQAADADGQIEMNLTCPSRPKWRYDMSKREVEANEEGLFRKWLAQTDAAVNAWCSPVSEAEPADNIAEKGKNVESTPELEMPHAPTSFERNLEVWRQLWRVTEISQVILVLLDSRCPILHYPPSLAAYLSSRTHVNRTRTILVLTKVDISGPTRAEAWTRYLNARYPGMRIVQVESYTEKEGAGATGRRTAYEPRLPTGFRRTLVDALRETHEELLEPPAHVKSQPEKLQRWKPRAPREIDWDAVLRAEGGQVGSVVGGAAEPRVRQHAEDTSEIGGEEEFEEEEEEGEPQFLTIGVIGQPNVGKSSLLNALFGTHKVKASRTPGKTKHFQTLFWTHDVRLVDCPGLVMPNYVPMEMQVLSGILPISRVSAIPLCIYHAAQLLPLERIYGLTNLELATPPPEDKRTWREGMRPRDAEAQRTAVWTAMDVLTAYALKKSWMTARTGRPDVSRAGNAILRALAEGKIRWAFWPPGTDPQTIQNSQGDGGLGIWIPHRDDGALESGDEHTAESDIDEARDDEQAEAASEIEEEDEGLGKTSLSGAAGRFSALVQDDDEDSTSSAESD